SEAIRRPDKREYEGEHRSRSVSLHLAGDDQPGTLSVRRRKSSVWKRSALRFERPAAILQALQLLLFPEAALLLLLEEGRQQGGGGGNLGKSSMPR
ncbi:unnamed protein product, partial [Ectocarpus sp. 13 AM-2016]